MSKYNGNAFADARGRPREFSGDIYLLPYWWALLASSTDVRFLLTQHRPAGPKGVVIVFESVGCGEIGLSSRPVRDAVAREENPST